jgi:hypothetical protein
MYGYPEQFIPAPELIGFAEGPRGSRERQQPALKPKEATS